MKAYDPLIDGDDVARLELPTAEAWQLGKIEELPESTEKSGLLDERFLEKRSMRPSSYSPEDYALWEKYHAATGDERVALSKSAAYKNLVKRMQKDWTESGAAEVVVKALYELTSNECRANYEALQFVIHVLSQLPSRPEVAPGSAVVGVIEGVCGALSRLTFFQADEESIAEAFAFPSLSSRNARAAANLRTDKDKVNDGYALWMRWVADPSLYKTKAAFTRDLINKEYCADAATPARWIKKWAANLPSDHSLQEKIAVKARRK